MPVARLALDQTWKLSWREATHLAPNDDCTWFGASESDKKAACLDLLRPREQMEEGGSIDDVHLSFKLAPVGSTRKNICNEECRLEFPTIHKEIISHVDQWAFNVQSVYILRRCTVGHQLAQVLSETASEIQQGFSILHTVNDLGI